MLKSAGKFVSQSILALTLIIFGILTPDQSAAEVRYALIIGNETYEHAGTLVNPVNDAKLIAQSLAAMGFEVDMFTDLSQDGLGEAIDNLAARANSTDVVAVYYSGHGLQKDGRNFLVPVDAEITSAASIERETVSLDSLIGVLKSFPVSMVFLDACRNNPFADALQAASTATKSVALSRGLAVVRAEGDMMITYATLPNTTASDGAGNNSPFASALARHVRTPDTEISVLMKRVTGDVVAETGGQQRPQQISQMQTEFYFQRTETGTVQTDPLRALLAVYPPRVSTGEEVSVVADVPPACTPFFSNLAPNGKLTPIPLQFFKSVALSNGQIRYEISPGSRYGLIIQEDDAPGDNQLGFLCEPRGIAGNNDAIRGLLVSVASKLQAGELAGFAEADGFGPVEYRFETFTIE